MAFRVFGKELTPISSEGSVPLCALSSTTKLNCTLAKRYDCVTFVHNDRFKLIINHLHQFLECGI